MNRLKQTNPWKEAIGIGLILLGVLLFVALISFDRGDLPGWAPLIFTTTLQNDPLQNLVGVVGALLAGYSYFLIGGASFWLALMLVGLGLGKLLLNRFQLPIRFGWGAVNLIATASLFNRLFPHWDDYIFKGNWAGGWIGHYVGDRAFGEPFGPVGSVIVLLGLYVVSLIFMTGFHPILFVRGVIVWIREQLHAAQVRRVDNLTEEQRLQEEREALAKSTEKLEKKLKKVRKPKNEADPVLPPAALAEREPVPAPKIIDASVPAQVKKPTLAELDAVRNSAKTGVEPGAGLAEVHLENYQLPPLDLLDPPDGSASQPADPQELLANQQIIIDTLAQFGVEAQAGDITKGPTITRFEIYPAKGVRVDRITSLEKDIARATKAERINILAPIPGKDTVGIEVANAKKVKVTLRELFETEAWADTKAKLPLALGKDVYGHTIIGDLAAMPHCLVAGTTGSGKSVCINSIIASLLFRYTPEELRFIMIDPKVVEMQIYNTLPHLVTPVVTDPKKVLLALKWLIDEMELRYQIFAKCGVRNIGTFNARPRPKTQAELDAEAAEFDAAEEAAEEADLMEPTASEEESEVGLGEANEPEDAPEPEAEPVKVPRDEDELIIPDKMPFIVVIIDELADLMQTAPADVEGAIARITQKARAAGIHAIVATQTPRAQVVTGVIKANIPSRIAFQVASGLDSRVILDDNGAEKLLGQGDMMYLPPGTSKMIRSQGVLVTDEEIRKIVEFVSNQSKPVFESSIHEKLNSSSSEDEDVTDEDQVLVDKCLEVIKQERRASTSMLQRRLRLGYTRAARVVDILEQRGIVGPRDGARDREILVDLDSL